MTKLRDKILTVLFTFFIGAVMLCLFLLPKETVSVNEKRTLASAPKLSLSGIISGKFENDVE